MEVYKKEKRTVKRCVAQIKKGDNEQFGRKMNRVWVKNRKLYWKEASKVNNEMDREFQ